MDHKSIKELQNNLDKFNKTYKIPIDKGTYVAVKPDLTTTEQLVRLIKSYNIPNPVPVQEFHSTLMYSKTHLDEFKAKGELNTPIVAEIIKPEVWTDRNGKKVLLLILECPELEYRHSELMANYNGSYDFDQYIPHLTLSYDYGYEHPQLVIPSGMQIAFSEEYYEDINPEKYS